eukprot:gene42064-66256_t
MKPRPRLACLVTAALLFGARALAQTTSTGAIEGRVLNPDNG